MDAARLTVTRQSPDDVRIRQLVVSFDGQPWGTLLYGDSITRELHPGSHRVRVHNTLVWKSLDLEVGAGEHVRLTAVNRAGFGTMSMISLLGAGPLYVTIKRDT
jgi:hypothetical protein